MKFWCNRKGKLSRSRMFWEIAALELPEKASAFQLSFIRIEGLLSAAKSEHYLGVFHGIFQNFQNNFLRTQLWVNASEKKRLANRRSVQEKKERVRKIFCSGRHVEKFVTASSFIGLINCWNMIIKIV